MIHRLSLAICFILLSCTPKSPQTPNTAGSHIDANVPDKNDFRAFLIRDLTAFLKLKYGNQLKIEYELLRTDPTQSGLAYPRFYLWLSATNADMQPIEGAVRVAAIDGKSFDVTHFIPSSVIVSNPDSVTRIFPPALIQKIRTKAGLKN